MGTLFGWPDLKSLGVDFPARTTYTCQFSGLIPHASMVDLASSGGSTRLAQIGSSSIRTRLIWSSPSDPRRKSRSKRGPARAPSCLGFWPSVRRSVRRSAARARCPTSTRAQPRSHRTRAPWDWRPRVTNRGDREIRFMGGPVYLCLRWGGVRARPPSHAFYSAT